MYVDIRSWKSVLKFRNPQFEMVFSLLLARQIQFVAAIIESEKYREHVLINKIKQRVCVAREKNIYTDKKLIHLRAKLKMIKTFKFSSGKR